MANDEEGITLGRYYDEATQHVGAKITYTGERHILFFGPNGTGKGTRFLISNLLSIKDRSIIVIDPKGELAAVTADYRRTIGDVVMLNPFNVLGLGSAGFNPLAALDPASANFYDDAAALGEALISIEGKDPHWSQSAQGLLVALLMWEKLKNGDKANLENVRAHADGSGQMGALHRRRRQATRAPNGWPHRHRRRYGRYGDERRL